MHYLAFYLCFHLDPPQNVYKNVEKTFKQLQEEVKLECLVECGNPSDNYEYVWTYANDLNTVLYRNKTHNEYIYKVNAQSTNEKFEIMCTVNNGISSDIKEPSQTKFTIRYAESTTTSGSGENMLLFFITYTLRIISVFRLDHLHSNLLLYITRNHNYTHYN